MTHPADAPSAPPASGTMLTWLVISWLWVGIPLGWGVSRTVMTSTALFTAPAPTTPAR